MEFSPAIGELAKALAAAQQKLGPLVAGKTATVKHKSGGQHSYTYADLADALAACRSTLNASGLAVVQETTTAQGRNGVEITTMLIHESGEWLRSSPLFMPVAATDAQAVGSAITYARRYQLLAVVGLAPEDDDGASASAAAPKRWQARSDKADKSDAAPKLERMRAAVDQKVKAYAEAYKVDLRKAWSEACSQAGYERPPGASPQVLGWDELPKINDAIKKALAMPRQEAP